jgi:hypothetical protein
VLEDVTKCRRALGSGGEGCFRRIERKHDFRETVVSQRPPDGPRLTTLVIVPRPAPQPAPRDSAAARRTTTAFTPQPDTASR